MNATLAIDTSTRNGRVAVASANDIVFTEEFISERSHNSQIFAPLKAALQVCNNRPSRIVVGTGPGSYTGIRIGIAAGLGISMTLKAPIIGIPSVCVAEAADLSKPFQVIGDARRGALFIVSVNGHLMNSEPELFETRKLLEDKLANNPGAVFSYDETAPLHNTILTHPSAEKLAKLAASLTDEETLRLSSIAPEPIYLRAPFITKPKKPGKSVSKSQS